jgi:hypothetical protein
MFMTDLGQGHTKQRDRHMKVGEGAYKGTQFLRNTEQIQTEKYLEQLYSDKHCCFVFGRSPVRISAKMPADRRGYLVFNRLSKQNDGTGP